ncbi:C2 domain-containing protein 3-like [Haliotis rubra]|uniref:C2 domain-containing protein 3-like n=1 Tax=Haliotis rubra TaxID=36100 RepID=UPI001EE5A2B9|nr:C2 domain-containing protein 3-like [Haliotis rubra]
MGSIPTSDISLETQTTQESTYPHRYQPRPHFSQPVMPQDDPFVSPASHLDADGRKKENGLPHPYTADVKQRLQYDTMEAQPVQEGSTVSITAGGQVVTTSENQVPQLKSLSPIHSQFSATSRPGAVVAAGRAPSSDVLSVLLERGKKLRDAMAVSSVDSQDQHKMVAAGIRPQDIVVPGTKAINRSSSTGSLLKEILLAEKDAASVVMATDDVIANDINAKTVDMVVGSPLQKNDFKMFQLLNGGSPGTSVSSDAADLSETGDPIQEDAILQELFYRHSESDGSVLTEMSGDERDNPVNTSLVSMEDPANVSPPSRRSSLSSLSLQFPVEEKKKPKRSTSKTRKKLRTREKTKGCKVQRSRSSSHSRSRSRTRTRSKLRQRASSASDASDNDVPSTPRSEVSVCPSTWHASDVDDPIQDVPKSKTVDGLSVERLTLLGRVHVARVSVDTLTLHVDQDTSLVSNQSSKANKGKRKGKPPRPTSKSKKPCTYFIEYQFPVVATSRDKYSPNTMATEVMRVASKNIKNNVVTFSHRSVFPIMFDGSSIEKWWKSALVFKVFSREAGQKIPTPVGSCGVSLKSILKSDSLCSDRQLEVRESSRNSSLNSSLRHNSLCGVFGHLKTVVELASDHREFATALAKTKLVEMSGKAKIVPIPEPAPSSQTAGSLNSLPPPPFVVQARHADFLAQSSSSQESKPMPSLSAQSSNHISQPFNNDTSSIAQISSVNHLQQLHSVQLQTVSQPQTNNQPEVSSYFYQFHHNLVLERVNDNFDYRCYMVAAEVPVLPSLPPASRDRSSSVVSGTGAGRCFSSSLPSASGARPPTESGFGSSSRGDQASDSGSGAESMDIGEVEEPEGAFRFSTVLKEVRLRIAEYIPQAATLLALPYRLGATLFPGAQQVIPEAATAATSFKDSKALLEQPRASRPRAPVPASSSGVHPTPESAGWLRPLGRGRQRSRPAQGKGKAQSSSTGSQPLRGRGSLLLLVAPSAWCSSRAVERHGTKSASKKPPASPDIPPSASKTRGFYFIATQTLHFQAAPTSEGNFNATVRSAQINMQPDVPEARCPMIFLIEGPVATNADRAATTSSQIAPDNLMRQIMKMVTKPQSTGVPLFTWSTGLPMLMQQPPPTPGAGARDLSTRNSYLVCRMFWCKDAVHSSVCWGTLQPQFNFLQVAPVLLSPALLERMRNNFLVIEVWDKKTAAGDDKLIGMVKLSLHQFYMSFRDQKVANALLKSQYPVIAADNYFGITDPFTSFNFGQLRLVLAMGSAEQIASLQRIKQDGDGSVMIPERPLNSLERHDIAAHDDTHGHPPSMDSAVEHVFEVVIEAIRDLKLFDNMMWGETDCFIQYHFPSQAQTKPLSHVKSIAPSMKCYRTATTLCTPDPTFHDCTRHKLHLPLGTPVQRELLTACANSGGGAGGLPFEVWCRYYHPNIREQVIAKAMLPLAKLCAMVTMQKRGETAIQSFSLPLSQVTTEYQLEDPEAKAKVKDSGLMDVTVNYKTKTIKTESASAGQQAILTGSQVCVSVGVIRATGLKCAAEKVSHLDPGMQYASEVGVNAYVRIKLSFLTNEGERITKTVARTFSPEFSHYLDFPCPLLWTDSKNDGTSLAELLEMGEATFEVWHQVPGLHGGTVGQYVPTGSQTVMGRCMVQKTVCVVYVTGTVGQYVPTGSKTVCVVYVTGTVGQYVPTGRTVGQYVPTGSQTVMGRWVQKTVCVVYVVRTVGQYVPTGSETVMGRCMAQKTVCVMCDTGTGQYVPLAAGDSDGEVYGTVGQYVPTGSETVMGGVYGTVGQYKSHDWQLQTVMGRNCRPVCPDWQPDSDGEVYGTEDCMCDVCYRNCRPVCPDWQRDSDGEVYGTVGQYVPTGSKTVCVVYVTGTVGQYVPTGSKTVCVVYVTGTVGQYFPTGSKTVCVMCVTGTVGQNCRPVCPDWQSDSDGEVYGTEDCTCDVCYRNCRPVCPDWQSDSDGEVYGTVGQYVPTGSETVMGRCMVQKTGDVLLGTTTVKLVSLLTHRTGLLGWHPVTIPSLGWKTSEEGDGCVQHGLQQVGGGLELSIRFAHQEDREKVIHAGRSVGWSPTLLGLEDEEDWETEDEASHGQCNQLTISVQDVCFPLQNALLTGHTQLEPSAKCYIRYKFYDKGAVSTKLSVLQQNEDASVSTTFRHKHCFLVPRSSPFHWYLREERLEVQVWVSYVSGRDKQSRPHHRDKLVGSAYIELGSLADTSRKQHRLSGVYSVLKPGAASLGGACVHTQVTSKLLTKGMTQAMEDNEDVVENELSEEDYDTEDSFHHLRTESTHKVKDKYLHSADSCSPRFAVHIFIERAMHLPRVTEKNKCGESEPSTYVSYQTAEKSTPSCTAIIPQTSNPVWEHEDHTHLSTELLYQDNKNLVLKVWHKPVEAAKQPDKSSDRVLGFVTVDLAPLSSGLLQICGWYNILDFTGQCKGQIKVSIVPEEPLSQSPQPDGVSSQTSLPSRVSSSFHHVPSLHLQPASLPASLPRLQEHMAIIRQQLQQRQAESLPAADVSPTADTQHWQPHFPNLPDPTQDTSKSYLFTSLRKQLEDLDSITSRLKEKLGSDSVEDGERQPVRTSRMVLTGTFAGLSTIHSVSSQGDAVEHIEGNSGVSRSSNIAADSGAYSVENSSENTGADSQRSERPGMFTTPRDPGSSNNGSDSGVNKDSSSSLRTPREWQDSNGIGLPQVQINSAKDLTNNSDRLVFTEGGDVMGEFLMTVDTPRDGLSNYETSQGFVPGQMLPSPSQGSMESRPHARSHVEQDIQESMQESDSDREEGEQYGNYHRYREMLDSEELEADDEGEGVEIVHPRRINDVSGMLAGCYSGLKGDSDGRLVSNGQSQGFDDPRCEAAQTVAKDDKTVQKTHLAQPGFRQVQQTYGEDSVHHDTENSVTKSRPRTLVDSWLSETDDVVGEGGETPREVSYTEDMDEATPRKMPPAQAGRTTPTLLSNVELLDTLTSTLETGEQPREEMDHTHRLQSERLLSNIDLESVTTYNTSHRPDSGSSKISGRSSGLSSNRKDEDIVEDTAEEGLEWTGDERRERFDAVRQEMDDFFSRQKERDGTVEESIFPASKHLSLSGDMSTHSSGQNLHHTIQHVQQGYDTNTELHSDRTTEDSGLESGTKSSQDEKEAFSMFDIAHRTDHMPNFFLPPENLQASMRALQVATAAATHMTQDPGRAAEKVQATSQLAHRLAAGSKIKFAPVSAKGRQHPTADEAKRIAKIFSSRMK